MNNNYKLKITVPSEDDCLIDYARHFTVNGEIKHKEALPDDAILTIKLLDGDNNVLRYVYQGKKNSDSVFSYHPDLTTYNESIDPGRKKMKKFGFPELMVNDINNPESSFKNATIKCWYSDDEFKAMIVSATDTEHGAIFNDGIGFLDEESNPYNALEKGNYKIVAELCSSQGELLCSDFRDVVIGNRENQLICRFNPVAHREKMTKWSEEMGICIANDPLPGYLDPYMGKWYYHMGLLRMYRANDIALYNCPVIYMFAYLIDPASTSYETELAFLQIKGIIENKKRFIVYHYDIGEAILQKGSENEKTGQILRFKDDEYLYLYRIDTVNEKARENVFDLSEQSIVSVCTDDEHYTVNAGDTIAFTGVVKPWQLEPEDFRLKDDNTYEISNSVCKIKYVFDDGIEKSTCERKLLMERIDGSSIGFSVYEFYNVFKIDNKLKGKMLTVFMTACDKNGENPKAKKIVRINVL